MAREDSVRCAISGASQGSRAVGVSQPRGAPSFTQAKEQKKDN
jgi:hypothetical protein